MDKTKTCRECKYCWLEDKIQDDTETYCIAFSGSTRPGTSAENCHGFTPYKPKNMIKTKKAMLKKILSYLFIVRKKNK